MNLQRPAPGAEGPYAAAYLPRFEMRLAPPGPPTGASVAKLGGEPVWRGEPSWPVVPRTGVPLDFIGQFPVPGEPDEEPRTAYLFLSYDDYETGGIDADDGEAVLLVQPGGRIPDFAVIGPPGTTGRSLWAFDGEEEKVPVEFRIDFRPVADELEAELEADGVLSVRTYIGGRPSYPDWSGYEAPWRFFFRLAQEEGDPYFLNFADGGGYAYLSPDRLEGRFKWEAA
ncbi:hypothetical protein AB0D46_23045 [Streptomyces sp. NPDC048383]|uniref:hypothetical protein n=1 Tax=Streptomyces sp. NPDC048383 TaxID=3155386 RepID=UPI0034297CF6